MAFASGTLARRRPQLDWLSSLVSPTQVLLLTLVGVELAALVAVLPETLETWWRVEETGDFQTFFITANRLEPNGMYSPALALLFRPLTYLSLANAYRVYVGLSILALAAITLVAQRGAGSVEGRLAVALGVLTIPQLHWALRLGHLTPFLALTALGGFLSLRRRPYLAGLCFALLALKPQYLPVPVLYLLWTRSGRALAALLAGVAVLELAGFAVVGFDTVGPYVRDLIDWGPDARDDLMAVQQAWQYAWPGFLISAGLEPNPLVVFDLVLLSLAAVALAWLRGDRTVAPVAAALGMLVVTPYANFYDWGLIVVAGALLLRARLRWPPLAPVILLGLYLAALASQAATPYPPQLDSPDAGATHGLYWITPGVLAAVCLLALSRERGQADAQSLPGQDAKTSFGGAHDPDAQSP